jgi:hypothetical protein
MSLISFGRQPVYRFQGSSIGERFIAKRPTAKTMKRAADGFGKGQFLSCGQSPEQAIELGNSLTTIF